MKKKSWPGKALTVLKLVGSRPVPVVSRQLVASLTLLVLGEATTFGLLPATVDKDAVASQVNVVVGVLLAVWALVHTVVALVAAHDVTPLSSPRDAIGRVLQPVIDSGKAVAVSDETPEAPADDLSQQLGDAFRADTHAFITSGVTPNDGTAVLYNNTTEPAPSKDGLTDADGI